MKLILFTSILLSTTAWAQTSYNKSINLNKVEHHQFKSLRKLKVKNGKAVVSGVKYNHSKEEYIDSGRRFSVPIDVFKRANQLSQSVFKATPGDTGGYGTAFYVGENLILTNQHVFSPNRKNTTKCKSFGIQLHSDQRNRFLRCKVVHYCSKQLDFCLIEMKAHKKGSSLKNYQHLNLVKNSHYSDQSKTMVIGNPLGYGIHASTGMGTKVRGAYTPLAANFYFYAPLFAGNSGGPIFNEENQVIGIATKQSKDLVSTKAYNIGLPMETVLNILEEKLKHKPEILKQINY